MVKKQYHILNIDLKDSHLRKLSDGKGLVLSGGMITEKGHPIHVSTKQMNAIKRKHSQGKRHILKFSPDEYHQNIEIQEGGALWKHFGRFIKNGAKKIGELYRDHIKPTLGPALKEGVRKTVESVVPKVLTGLTTMVAPEFAPVVAPLYDKIGQKASEPITDYIGKTTKAYGLENRSGFNSVMIPAQDTPKAQVAPDFAPNRGSGLIMSSGSGLYLKGAGSTFPQKSVRDYRLNPPINHR